MKWLFALTLLLTFTVAPAQTVTAPPGNCAVDLASAPAYRLGIGVLVETESGEIHLGTSPYAGSLHTAIVDKLLESLAVKQILWMGELRYRVDQGRPEIQEANETSGYYSTLRKNGLSHQTKTIAVSNSFANLPPAFRTADFDGHTFDLDNMRLAQELRYVKGDVRHSIGNSLQMLLSQTVILGISPIDDDQKRQMIADFRVNQSADLILLRWLVLNLIQDGRVSAAEFDSFLNLISMYENPRTTLEQLRAVTIADLDRQIQRLSRIVSPRDGLMIVDLYRLR